MHYILYLALDGFYVGSLAEPADAVYRDGVILDSNPAAKERHVRVGMPLGEARAIFPEGRYRPFRHEEFADATNLWLDVVASFSDVVEPGEPHVAWVDLSEHPEPREAALEVVQSLRSVHTGPIRAGLAPCRWLAEATAEVAVGQPFENVLIDDLPIARLLPVSPQARQRMHFLGYRRLGEIARVDPARIREQFPEEAEVILRTLRGRGDVTVHARYPPDSRGDRVWFPEPIEEWEPLRLAITEIAERMGRALMNEDWVGHDLEMRIETGQTVRRMRRTFTKPIHTPGSLFASAMLLHKEFEDLAGDVIAVGLRIFGLQRVRATQTEMIAPKRIDHRLTTAVDTVRSTFGESSVLIASQMVESRRKRLHRTWREVSGWP